VILVDTSVWVDHLRTGVARLAAFLERGEVVMHPFVVGEIACGNLAQRSSVLELLQNLPAAVVAEPIEVLAFVEGNRLYGRGLGYVDVHLLASIALTEATTLWTRDKRLGAVAQSLGYAFPDPADG
jgi:predicted nucleic acid-binding protein